MFLASGFFSHIGEKVHVGPASDEKNERKKESEIDGKMENE